MLLRASHPSWPRKFYAGQGVASSQAFKLVDGCLRMLSRTGVSRQLTRQSSFQPHSLSETFAKSVLGQVVAIRLVTRLYVSIPIALSCPTIGFRQSGARSVIAGLLH